MGAKRKRKYMSRFDGRPTYTTARTNHRNVDEKYQHKTTANTGINACISYFTEQDDYECNCLRNDVTGLCVHIYFVVHVTFIFLDKDAPLKRKIKCVKPQPDTENMTRRRREGPLFQPHAALGRWTRQGKGGGEERNVPGLPSTMYRQRHKTRDIPDAPFSI